MIDADSETEILGLASSIFTDMEDVLNSNDGLFDRRQAQIRVLAIGLLRFGADEADWCERDRELRALADKIEADTPAIQRAAYNREIALKGWETRRKREDK